MDGWVVYLSESPPERLVVFVHGFGGQAVGTWERFPESARVGDWWRASDMLFVGYDSVRDSIAGAANRLRRHLPDFYPRPPAELLDIEGVTLRPLPSSPYQELVLVGHSLGGVVVRRALSDAAGAWLDQRETDPKTLRPALLGAKVRLFSPASAGFRSAGWLGLVQASPIWIAVNMYLRRSSAYSDLQPGSQFLADTRRRTETLVTSHPDDLRALRASILWANPDEVVLTERYDSDLVDDTVDNTTHRGVCKPCDSYPTPWRFVESGHRR